MTALGVGIVFAGYSLTYYGLTQLKGGNWGLFDLVLPTRYAAKKDTPRDGKTGGQ